MVESGVDRLSREATVDQHDVRVRLNTWLSAMAMASANGMRLDVDWFADPNNQRLSRFWSREPSKGAEGVDALSTPTWGRSGCRECGMEHDHGAWLFPPAQKGVLARMVTKLKADRAHGVALVPFRPAQSWWSVLAKACTGKRSTDSIRNLTAGEAFEVCCTVDAERSTYLTEAWRLCCFDFSADSRRCYTEQCGAATPLEPTVSPEELGHRRYLRSLVFFGGKPEPR